MIACGRSAKYDVGRHVLLYDTAALHKTIATYAGEVLKYDAGGKYHVALKRAFACNLRAYADDVVVAHLHVVADVDVVHEEVAVADDCGCLVLKSASNDDILADAVLVADTHVSTVSYGIAETLRHGTNDGILIDVVVRAEHTTFENAGVGHDDAAVANDNVALDVCKGIYLYVLANLGFWMNVG